MAWNWRQWPWTDENYVVRQQDELIKQQRRELLLLYQRLGYKDMRLEALSPKKYQERPSIYWKE